jgi:hypothetical protein
MYVGPREDFPARPLVHHQDEPTKLSLGMVASWSARRFLYQFR